MGTEVRTKKRQIINTFFWGWCVLRQSSHKHNFPTKVQILRDFANNFPVKILKKKIFKIKYLSEEHYFVKYFNIKLNLMSARFCRFCTYEYILSRSYFKISNLLPIGNLTTICRQNNFVTRRHWNKNIWIKKRCFRNRLKSQLRKRVIVIVLLIIFRQMPLISALAFKVNINFYSICLWRKEKVSGKYYFLVPTHNILTMLM